MTDPKDKSVRSKTSGQNTNAGWYNRFVQTGKSDHETKSNECFGGLCATCMMIVGISLLRVLYNCRLCAWHPHHAHCVCRLLYIFDPSIDCCLFIHMCIACVPGLGVGQVGSSFTGNLHPTPCIEWMQGKRGDPGCMAKARVHILLLAHCHMH